MKISKSKQELARIISENGGWREMAEFSAQDKDGYVYHFATKPTINAGHEVWHHKGCIGEGEFTAETLPNWHQTILSRTEYFHLYPEHTETEYKDGVKPTDPAKADGPSKPTIEQLAADYRNKLDYANRKQDEANKANMESDAALSQLEDAIAAIGFAITPLGAPEKEPEPVITDWQDLRVGDEIEVFNFECPWNKSSRKQELMSGPCIVMRVDGENVLIELKNNLPTKGPHWNATGIDACDFKFIRRP